MEVAVCGVPAGIILFDLVRNRTTIAVSCRVGGREIVRSVLV